jgi:hypothetical protein
MPRTTVHFTYEAKCRDYPCGIDDVIQQMAIANMTPDIAVVHDQTYGGDGGPFRTRVTVIDDGLAPMVLVQHLAKSARGL